MIFETFEGKNGEYYFNLKNENKVILKSEGYTTTDARNNGIESVKKNGILEGKYESDNNNFNLKAGNGQIIATSTIFSSKEEVEIAKKEVMDNVETAEVRER